MSDRMEQFLADQLEAGRVLDAVIAQTEAQSRNMSRIREAWPRHRAPKVRA